MSSKELARLVTSKQILAVRSLLVSDVFLRADLGGRIIPPLYLAALRTNDAGSSRGGGASGCLTAFNQLQTPICLNLFCESFQSPKWTLLPIFPILLQLSRSSR